MPKIKINISPKLKSDLKTYSTSICVGLAAKTRDIMYEEAKSAISIFYNSYSPIYYDRNYYNFKTNSFKKYYRNPHNSIIRGGIELTPDELDEIYKINANYIFKLVYTGHHGNVSAFPHTIYNIPPVTKPPIQILLDKRREIINNINDYKSYAISIASNKTYSVIRA